LPGAPPADERGIDLAPFTLGCGTPRECLAWSADSRTLFAQGQVAGSYGLYAIDAATRTVRRFGNAGYYGRMHALPDNSASSSSIIRRSIESARSSSLDSSASLYRRMDPVRSSLTASISG
jgi:hypothetical protein